MQRKLRIGTRDSALALAQTGLIADRIGRRYPEWELEVVPLKTSGDLILDQSLDKIGGKGLFIKEIEAALLNGRIDLAVHSLKDMPAPGAPGLKIAAYSVREDPRDVLVARRRQSLDELPSGAVVGTSSIRREVQILRQRPDLKVAPLRGNILTRLDKLRAGRYEAIVLAAAGLIRLGIAAQITQYFAVEELIPAAGQGILALQARDDTNCEYLRDCGVHCPEAAACAGAERAYLVKLEGDCSTPAAVHARIDGANMTVSGLWVNPETGKVYRETVAGRPEQAARLGERLAGLVRAQTRGGQQ
jgi:hydroxymethylbilane synthase